MGWSALNFPFMVGEVNELCSSWLVQRGTQIVRRISDESMHLFNIRHEDVVYLDDLSHLAGCSFATCASVVLHFARAKEWKKEGADVLYCRGTRGVIRN